MELVWSCHGVCPCKVHAYSIPKPCKHYVYNCEKPKWGNLVSCSDFLKNGLSFFRRQKLWHEIFIWLGYLLWMNPESPLVDKGLYLMKSELLNHENTIQLWNWNCYERKINQVSVIHYFCFLLQPVDRTVLLCKAFSAGEFFSIQRKKDIFWAFTSISEKPIFNCFCTL